VIKGIEADKKQTENETAQFVFVLGHCSFYPVFILLITVTPFAVPDWAHRS
jgi:hypothetical protein